MSILKKLIGLSTPEDELEKLQKDYTETSKKDDAAELLLQQISTLNTKLNSSLDTINALSELLLTMSEQQTKMQSEQKAQSELLFTIYMIFEEMAAASAAIIGGSAGTQAPKKKNITDLAEIKPVTPTKGNKQSN